MSTTYLHPRDFKILGIRVYPCCISELVCHRCTCFIYFLVLCKRWRHAGRWWRRRASIRWSLERTRNMNTCFGNVLCKVSSTILMFYVSSFPLKSVCCFVCSSVLHLLSSIWKFSLASFFNWDVCLTIILVLIFHFFLIIFRHMPLFQRHAGSLPNTSNNSFNYCCIGLFSY